MANAVYISTDLGNGPIRARALGLSFRDATGWNFTPPCVVIYGGNPYTNSSLADNALQVTTDQINAALAPLTTQEIALAATVATNTGTIQNRLNTNLTTLENWITANPSGAVLTAGQTLVLAKMLVGLTRVLLQEATTTGGS